MVEGLGNGRVTVLTRVVHPLQPVIRKVLAVGRTIRVCAVYQHTLSTI